MGVCEGQVAFFRMLAHPFGLTQSVFNYNRRGCLLTSILVKVFSLVCLSFHDDRFGVTVKELAVEEAEIVKFVCMLLGVSLSQKSQAGRVLEILGVTFDLSKGRLLILEDKAPFH